MKTETIEKTQKPSEHLLERNTREIKTNANADMQIYTALCSNCDERFSCKIRNNTSVIWHCEEYK